MKNSNRIAWLDNTRLLAMIVMLVGHVCRNMTDMTTVAGAVEYELFSVAFNMPLFVILSGYGNFGSLTRINTFYDLCKKLWKCFVSILLPVLFPIFIYCIIDGRWDAFGFETILWFLWMLFYVVSISSICFFTVRMFIKYLLRFKLLHRLPNNADDYVLWFASIVSIVVGIFFNRAYSGEFITYFVVGLLFRRYNVLEMLKSKWYVWTGFGLISLLIYIMYYDVQTSHLFYWSGIRQMKSDGLLGQYVLRQFISIGLSVAIIQLIMLLSNKRTRFSEWGMHTLAIYVIQEVFMHYSEYIQLPYIGERATWIPILLMMIIIMGVSITLAKLIRNVKIG